MTQEITHIPNSIHGLRQTAMKFATQAANAKRRLAKMGEENSKTMDGVVDIVEVVGAAFAISYINGKYGTPATGTPAQIAGIDADILAAGVCAGAAMFDVMGEKYSPHLYTIAGGFAAAWATREGLALGSKPATTTSTVAAAA